MNIAEKLQAIAENEQKVKELNDELESILYGTDTGGRSWRENFWHNIWYEPDGSLRTYYRNAFGTWCNVNTFKPIYIDELCKALNLLLKKQG